MRLFTKAKRSKRQLAQSVTRGETAPDVNSEEQFPLDLERLAQEQKEDKELQKLLKKDKVQASKGKVEMVKEEVINDVEVLTYNKKIYVPSSLRKDVLNWYHHYLQHPGANRMELSSLLA